jgi:hypothetical protein
VEDAVVVHERDRVAGRDGEQVRGEPRRAVAELRGRGRCRGRRLGRLEVDDRAREVGGAEALAARDEPPAQRRGPGQGPRRRCLGPAEAAERAASEPEGEEPQRREGRAGTCGGALHPPSFGRRPGPLKPQASP